MNSLKTAPSLSTSAPPVESRKESRSELQTTHFSSSTGSKHPPVAEHISHSTRNHTRDGLRSTSPIEDSLNVPPSAQKPIPSIRMISAESGLPRSQSSAIAEDVITSEDGTSPHAWSSAVGKANLGKSGRVIERLMGENDMLKRDLQIEKLKAEESRNAKKMAEGKMEALTSDFEGRLHDAAINKTLLKRRERQVNEMKAQLETERLRADAAVESERGWKSAMEKLEVEAKQKVDESSNYAILVEGRYRTLSLHWKEQGALVDAAISRMQGEISTMIEDRRNDARRMDLLHQVCDQQADRLKELEKEKANIAQAYENYKVEQERLLHEIKARTREQEQANEEALAATNLVLGQLKWALAVKRNLRDNQ